LGDRLPTKTELRPVQGGKPAKHYKLDWTLGPETARLRDVTGADYAMFVYTHDSYGDAGRKVAQLLMAGLFGAYMPAGVHIGYAGLVDLHNGDIVWFNTDLAMGGDPRDSDGAQKRVGQLLEGFPEHNPSPLAGVSATQDDVTAAAEQEVAAPTQDAETDVDDDVGDEQAESGETAVDEETAPEAEAAVS